MRRGDCLEGVADVVFTYQRQACLDAAPRPDEPSQTGVRAKLKCLGPAEMPGVSRVVV